jgi:hypothetical protein
LVAEELLTSACIHREFDGFEQGSVRLMQGDHTLVLGSSMIRVTVDATTAAQLHEQVDCLELCDEAGNVLGHFTPDERSPVFREWLRNLDSGLTPEEIDRRVASGQGMTTDELLAKLRGQRN